MSDAANSRVNGKREAVEVTCDRCGHTVVREIRPRYCESCGHRLPPQLSDEPTIPPRGSPDGAQSPALAADAVLGHYQLHGLLGCGGMGHVYAATDRRSGRAVALKILSESLARDAATVDRFVREGRLAASLSHPRTTFVYEAGQVDGRPFIAMERMPGTTLADVLKDQGPLPVRDAVDYILDVIEGLIAAHQLNVIHRDVKPANCFIDHGGRVKIGDFGLSKQLLADVNLTQSGTFMGTPSYAAPEQVRGGELDPRTDVYSVGATLFTLIANRPPFTGDALAVTAQIVSDPAPDLRALVSDVPRGLSAIISKALRKDPSERFETLDLMRRALLPYATRGASLAEIGRRSAAYAMDYLVVSLLLQTLLAAAVLSARALWPTSASLPLSAQLEIVNGASVIGTFVLLLLYFTICEGFWGQTLGKRLLGLRVIDAAGERPGVGRSLLRSLAVPAAFGIPLVGLLFYRSGGGGNLSLDMESILAGWGLARAVELVPVLLCAATMRPGNGLRGIHGLLSGTRVIRLESDTSRSFLTLPPPPVARRKSPIPEVIGTYRVDGVLAQSAGRDVLLAWDTVLQRHVWVYLLAKGSEGPPHPHAAEGSGRCRALQGGAHEGRRWEAFEAITGVPFAALAANSKWFTWENTRRALSDYASELYLSQREKSLPPELLPDQFWVEADGRGKILEWSWNSTREADCTAVKPVARLQELLATVCSRQILPRRVHDAMKGFEADAEPLEWLSRVAGWLKAEQKKLARLRWDSRLGVLSISLGVESVAYTGVMLATSWFLLRGAGPQVSAWMGIPVALYFLLLFAIGFAMRGAPVFRFMGVDVQRRAGGLASRWQCGLRHGVAWLPSVLLVVSAYLLLNFSFSVLQADGADPSSAVAEAVLRQPREFPASYLAIVTMAAVASVLLYLGPVVSLIRPERGIQDWIAGTRLVPR